MLSQDFELFVEDLSSSPIEVGVAPSKTTSAAPVVTTQKAKYVPKSLFPAVDDDPKVLRNVSITFGGVAKKAPVLIPKMLSGSNSDEAVKILEAADKLLGFFKGDPVATLKAHMTAANIQAQLDSWLGVQLQNLTTTAAALVEEAERKPDDEDLRKAVTDTNNAVEKEKEKAATTEAVAAAVAAGTRTPVIVELWAAELGVDDTVPLHLSYLRKFCADAAAVVFTVFIPLQAHAKTMFPIELAPATMDIGPLHDVFVNNKLDPPIPQQLGEMLQFFKFIQNPADMMSTLVKDDAYAMEVFMRNLAIPNNNMLSFMDVSESLTGYLLKEFGGKDRTLKLVKRWLSTLWVNGVQQKRFVPIDTLPLMYQTGIASRKVMTLPDIPEVLPVNLAQTQTGNQAEVAAFNYAVERKWEAGEIVKSASKLPFVKMDKCIYDERQVYTGLLQPLLQLSCFIRMVQASTSKVLQQPMAEGVVERMQEAQKAGIDAVETIFKSLREMARYYTIINNGITLDNKAAGLPSNTLSADGRKIEEEWVQATFGKLTFKWDDAVPDEVLLVELGAKGGEMIEFTL